MKRDYTNMVRHSDGTYSGVHSTTRLECFTVFRESQFTITGYYKTEQEELIELLFLWHSKGGVVVRRIFDECVFSFIDFSREQIDDVMNKIGGRQKPSHLSYSFTNCKVLSDGVEIPDYPLKRDATTTFLLETMPTTIKTAATRKNIQIRYNLRKLTYYSPKERPTFFDEYHHLMKTKREVRDLKRRKYSVPEETALCLLC